MISDACGLVESAAEFFPEADWQRCVVHWYRNVFSHVPNGKSKWRRCSRRSTPRRTARPLQAKAAEVVCTS